MRRAGVILLLAGTLAQAAEAPYAPPTLRIDREVVSSRELALEAGQSRLLVTSEEIVRVAVASPAVADLRVVTPTQLLLTAKAPGTTDLTLWNRAESPLVVTLRVTRGLDALRKQLGELFPREDVKVSSTDDLIVLSGQVGDVRLPERMTQLARLHGERVANLVSVVGDQQVQLEVRFAEVARTALTELGVNFFHKTETPLRVGGLAGPGINPGAFLNSGQGTSVPGSGRQTSTGQPPDVYAPSFTNAFSLFFSQSFSALPFSVTLSLLQANGLAKVLAEPTLVTLTGQEARFLAGGELPIPLSSALGQVNVTWKKFGIQLAFTPTVLGQDAIHLKLATEVSELDPSIAVAIAGTSVPGFTTRLGETTVRLGDGQSFVIAGLLAEKAHSQVDRVPLLGSIPVLGALFRSTAYRREETELLVVVTARLARPLSPHELPPMPTDGVRAPSDAELLLFGVQEGDGATSPARPAPAGAGPVGEVGFFR